MSRSTRPGPRRPDDVRASRSSGGGLPPIGLPAIFIALGVAAVAWFSLDPILDNSFIDVDDGDNFAENHAYRGFGPAQFVYAFGGPRASIYQPLNSLLWSLVYCRWGLDPRGYHLASLVLHALNAVVLLRLVWAIIARWRPELARDRPTALLIGSGLAVAWFASHPARVEPVAWATTLLYLSCSFLAILATLTYLSAHPPGGAPIRRGRLAGAYVLAFSAMLCMPGGVVLPLIFAILDVSVLGRIDLEAGSISTRCRRVARLGLEKLPLLLAAGALGGVAYWAKKTSQAVAAGGVDGPWARLAQAGYGFWYSAIKAIEPFGIGSFHPRPEHGDFGSPIFAASVAGLFVGLAAVIAFRRRVRWLPAASAAYILILTPHLGLVPVSETIAADRYAYLASVVMVVPLAAGLAGLVRPGRSDRVRYATIGLSLALILGLAIASRGQARIWQNPEAYWAEALRRLPGSSLVHSRYGRVLAQDGRHVEALEEYDRALAIRPDDPGTLIKRGASLAALGRPGEAIEADRAALVIWPRDSIARLNLGIALASLGHLDEALAEIREAIASGPRLAPCRVKLGDVLLMQGHADEAAAAYRGAIEIAPWDAQAHTGLGSALSLRNDPAGAIEAYRAALREDPRHVPALLNLGIALAQSGRPAEAIGPLTTAVGLNPSNADAHHVLGICYAGVGQIDSAVSECTEALRLDPRQAQARLFLEQARRPGGLDTSTIR